MKYRIGLLILALLFFSENNHAQLQTGSRMYGGSFRIYGTSSVRSGESSIDNNSWMLMPQLGWVIKPNVLIGVQLGITGYRYQYDLNQKTTMLGPAAGFFARRYYPLSARWALIAAGAFSGEYQSVQTKTINGVLIGSVKGLNFSLTATPGITFRAGKSIWLESQFDNLLRMGWGRQVSKTFDLSGTESSRVTNSQTVAELNTPQLNSLVIGIRWILPPRK